MSNNKIVRIGAASAVVSGLVWLILTPFMATIGICRGPCPSWTGRPLVIRTLGRAIADQGWLCLDPPDTLYFAYGRYFFLVYGLIIFGLLALHRAQALRAGPRRPLDQRAYRLLLGSLLLALLGDFTSYGLGVFSQAAWRYGFGVEVLAWLGVLLGALAYGVAILRQRTFHPLIGWLLTGAALLIPATFFDRILVHYAPNAQLLPFAVVWPIIGLYLLATKHQPLIPS